MITRRSAGRALALAAALAASTGAGRAGAGVARFPVAAQVIYPGDRITDAMLKDSPDPPEGDDVLSARGQIVGKVARRTLLPGRPIPAIAVEEPRAVSMGALVKLVYQNEGLSIVTNAQALQNGHIGEVVQVRNMESGIIVSGAIQADGSVLVNGG
jgi:flagella basal body P-ring formation protein FlgA